ncbi:MAG TPA: hypothetical protein EYQ31_01780 [Candidatus Handelsmanbacteria bacterium]|nr:hypothetical protein [Candidatus Handelsmanbacteria bacterium]
MVGIENWESRMWRDSIRIHEFAESSVCPYPNDLGARSHYVSNFHLPESEDVFEHFTGVFLDRAFGFTEVEPVTTGDQGSAKGDAMGDDRMFASTDIRVLVRRGQVDEAAARLGRAWEIEARVQHGDARGTTMGYPTANLPVVGALHPDAGIYAVRVGMIEDGVFSWHDGAAYIGTRPTFAGEETLLEVFLLDFKGDLYGKRLRVAFVERVREDKVFDNPDALIAQMDIDCARAREILGRETAPLATANA